MTIRISEILPMLDTILQQQGDISIKLGQLIETFQRSPEPVEPALRELLAPLCRATEELKDALKT